MNVSLRSVLGFLAVLIVIAVGAYSIWFYPYATYTNEEYNFSIEYPRHWTYAHIENPGETGGIVSFQSDNHIEAGLGPYDVDLKIHFWPTINTVHARGGGWYGQRDFEDLADFFTDEKAPKQKIGELNIHGILGHEVLVGGHGQNYAVMFETDRGIYELSFLNAYDQYSLSDAQIRILESTRIW